MAQFTPSKKTIKDFNDGEEYLNRIDVVQADTVNNLVEGLLYAQEHGESVGDEFVKKIGDEVTGDIVRVGQTSDFADAAFRVRINNVGETSYGLLGIRRIGGGENYYLTYPLKNGELAVREDIITDTATSSSNGLMSSTDKSHLDEMWTLFGTEAGDPDELVNTVREVLKTFESLPEGTDIAKFLSSKADASSLDDYVKKVGDTITGVLNATQEGASSTSSFSYAGLFTQMGGVETSVTPNGFTIDSPTQVTQYMNGAIYVQTPKGNPAIQIILPKKSGTLLVEDDLNWENLTGKPSWIGESKPTYSWDEIEDTPTIPSEYTLPQATDSILGGIKIGARQLSAKQYAVLLNNEGQAYVSVPWDDNTHNTAYLYLSNSATSTTQTSGSFSDPYMNLIDGAQRRTSIHLIGGTGVTVSASGSSSISRAITISGFDGDFNSLKNAPEALKNPYPLSITVSGTTISYDGSAERSITIPTGGGSGSTIDIAYDKIMLTQGDVFHIAVPKQRGEKYIYFFQITMNKEVVKTTDGNLGIEWYNDRKAVQPVYATQERGGIVANFILIFEGVSSANCYMRFNGEDQGLIDISTISTVECEVMMSDSSQMSNVSYTCLQVL